MMLQKRSNPWMRTKALYIIPVAVIALSAFATPELNNRVDAIAEQAPSVIADKGTTNSAIVQEKLQKNAIAADSELASIADDVQNEQSVLYLVDGKEVSRSELNSILPDKIQSITIVKQKEGISKLTDKKDVTAVIVVSTKDSETKSAVLSSDKAYDIVDHMPEYPGGMEAMMKFISENVKYPDEAKKQGISGRAIIEFIVEKDGAISGVKTKHFRNSSSDKNNAEETTRKSIDVGVGFATVKEEGAAAKEVASNSQYVQAYNSTKLLTDEAERVVKSMPKWEPGTQGGKPVRVHYFLPITFNPE